MTICQLLGIAIARQLKNSTHIAGYGFDILVYHHNLCIPVLSQNVTKETVGSREQTTEYYYLVCIQYRLLRLIPHIDVILRDYRLLL